MKNSIKIFGWTLILSFCCFVANASNTRITSIDQSKVISAVKKTEIYIKKNGIERAIIEFKNSDNIFIGN